MKINFLKMNACMTHNFIFKSRNWKGTASHSFIEVKQGLFKFINKLNE